MTTNNLPRDLGDGLVLRRSTPADAEKLFVFNSMIHSDDGPEKPDDRIGWWTRDLLEKPHPSFGSDDFTLVEEQATGRVISSLNLISQTWRYEGIPFKVGRPELVGTLPEYRYKGLVRQQFEEIHRWSADRGEVVQAITGIPFYYRQFDYEMGLDLGGGHVGFEPNLPKLKDGEPEPYTLRRAVVADIPFIMEMTAQNDRRSMISAVWDEAYWSYTLTVKSERNVTRDVVMVIEESASSEPVGMITHTWFTWGELATLSMFEVRPGVSWLAVAPSVARYLWKFGEEYLRAEGKHVNSFGFWLGQHHPAYEVFRERLPHIRQPYAWYVRVPDLPGFVRLITPALEKRVAESYIPGHSGALKVSFYREGLRLVLERGKLVEVEPWKPRRGDDGDAAFPNLTFLQMVFGYRSFEELHASYADCWWEHETARVVLSTLFPRKSSDFLGIG